MKKGAHSFTPIGTNQDPISPEARVGRKAGNDSLDEIYDLISQTRQIAQKSLPLYRALVDRIINKKITDPRYIERTLDYLTSLLYMGTGQEEFKRLVSYYQKIDSEASKSYKDSALVEGLIDE